MKKVFALVTIILISWLAFLFIDSKPPVIFTHKIPSWSLEPRMLLWQTQPQDTPYPFTILSYKLKITNKEINTQKSIQVFMRSSLFDWRELGLFDEVDVESKIYPILLPKQQKLWGTEFTWNELENPAWRKIIEDTLEFRFIWKEIGGWYELKGHFPSQYEGNIFDAYDLIATKP
jgi:hypothetical protein